MVETLTPHNAQDKLSAWFEDYFRDIFEEKTLLKFQRDTSCLIMNSICYYIAV